jgi:lipid-binding SYLF domain-containing protein
MKWGALIGVLLMALLTFSPMAYGADDYSETIKVFKGSPLVKEFFSNSYGYAIFPTIGKGGLVVGASHGSGQVYRIGVVTGKTSMTQITIGLQAGGQAFSQIIFFKDQRAYDEFISGSFEFGAQATAVAITAGAQAQAGSTGTSAGASGGSQSAGTQAAAYHKGMAVFTHAKGGLMFEAAIGGQKFKYEPLGTGSGK